MTTFSIGSKKATSGVGGSDHGSRWFEVQASRMGAKHFDEKYGSGAAGYIQGSADYFDYESFSNSNYSPYYINPRYGTNYQGTYPTSGARFSIWDIIVPLSPLSGVLSLTTSKIIK